MVVVSGPSALQSLDALNRRQEVDLVSESDSEGDIEFLGSEPLAAGSRLVANAKLTADQTGKVEPAPSRAGNKRKALEEVFGPMVQKKIKLEEDEVTGRPGTAMARTSRRRTSSSMPSRNETTMRNTQPKMAARPDRVQVPVDKKLHPKVVHRDIPQGSSNWSFDDLDTATKNEGLRVGSLSYAETKTSHGLENQSRASHAVADKRGNTTQNAAPKSKAAVVSPNLAPEAASVEMRPTIVLYPTVAAMPTISVSRNKRLKLEQSSKAAERIVAQNLACSKERAEHLFKYDSSQIASESSMLTTRPSAVAAGLNAATFPCVLRHDREDQEIREIRTHLLPQVSTDQYTAFVARKAALQRSKQVQREKSQRLREEATARKSSQFEDELRELTTDIAEDAIPVVFDQECDKVLDSPRYEPRDETPQGKYNSAILNADTAGHQEANARSVRNMTKTPVRTGESKQNDGHSIATASGKPLDRVGRTDVVVDTGTASTQCAKTPELKTEFAAQRSAAANVRKQADANKEAEWIRRNAEKRRAEGEKAEQAVKVKEAQRAASSRRQAEEKLHRAEASGRTSVFQKLMLDTKSAAQEHSNPIKLPNAVNDSNDNKDASKVSSDPANDGPAVRPGNSSTLIVSDRDSASGYVSGQTNDLVKRPRSASASERPAEGGSMTDASEEAQRVTKQKMQPRISRGPTIQDIEQAFTRTNQASRTDSDCRWSPQPCGGSNIDRDQRVQALIDRNARLRLADRESDLGPDTSDSASSPVCQRPPLGPVSSNSNDGQRLFTHSTSNIHKQPKQNHDRKLVQISAEDILLLRWRDEGLPFSRIAQLMEQKAGYKRGRESHGMRYRKVRNALEAAHVPLPLQNLVVSGCPQARKELNDMLRQQSSTTAAVSSPLRLKSEDQESGYSTPPSTAISRNNQSFNAASDPVLRYDLAESTVAARRPHSNVSGKTLTPENMQYWMESYAKELLADHEEESRSIRKPSPVTDEDCCQFIYRIQRRSLSREQTEDGEQIEETPWIDCGKTSNDWREANAAAAQWILSVPRGTTSTVDFSQPFSLVQHALDGDSLASFTLTGHDGGIVEVHVVRSLRTYHNGYVPPNSERWLSRRVYWVREKITIEEANGTTTTERNLDKTGYTTLEQANQRAVKEFVKMAFTPTSIHLGQRSVEIQTMEGEFLDGLEEGEEFYQEAQNEDGREKLEVWVEEGRLAGPRNL